MIEIVNCNERGKLNARRSEHCEIGVTGNDKI